MLTPQEIKEKSFDKVMVWGYDMNAVDSFKESISADYAQLYKENIALKSKMKVLIEKIEEYRSVDDSMRKALLNAQTMATKMVEDAKMEIENRERMASERMDEKLRELKMKVEAEDQRYCEAKKRSDTYINMLCEAYAKEIEKLTALKSSEDISAAAAEPIAITIEEPVKAEEPKEEVIPDTVPLPFIPPAQEISVAAEEPDSDMNVFEVDMSEAVEEPEKKAKPVFKPVVDDDEETITLSPKPKFEFSNLQFGDKYDPSKKPKK